MREAAMATAVATRNGQQGGKGHHTMLAVAVSHRVRSLVFSILRERVASPAELGRELMIDVNQIAYHVRTLRKWELIELIDTRQVRGATEHFFAAVKLAEVTDEEEETQSPAERHQYAETILSMFTADAVRSLDSGLLYQRTDHFLTRFAYEVDEQGWEETRDVYRVCFEKVKEIEETSSLRVRKKREEAAEEEKRGRKSRWQPLRMMSFLGMFELPPLNARNGGAGGTDPR
jgi:predicted ArsR family transcriptional regulator